MIGCMTHISPPEDILVNSHWEENYHKWYMLLWTWYMTTWIMHKWLSFSGTYVFGHKSPLPISIFPYMVDYIELDVLLLRAWVIYVLLIRDNRKLTWSPKVNCSTNIEYVNSWASEFRLRDYVFTFNDIGTSTNNAYLLENSFVFVSFIFLFCKIMK